MDHDRKCCPFCQFSDPQTLQEIWSFLMSEAKELHHKKAVTKLFGVRRSRLGPIQIQAVLKRPEWRASAKLAESPVMIIKSVFLI